MKTEPCLRFDMRKYSWNLLEHQPRRITSVADFELIPFLKNGESYIRGEEMLRRARGQNVDLSQEDAEWLLDHQHEIPEEFRTYYLLFLGSVWQIRNRDCFIPYLHWGDGKWCLSWVWLGCGWGSEGCFLRLRKAA